MKEPRVLFLVLAIMLSTKVFGQYPSGYPNHPLTRAEYTRYIVEHLTLQEDHTGFFGLATAESKSISKQFGPLSFTRRETVRYYNGPQLESFSNSLDLSGAIGYPVKVSWNDDLTSVGVAIFAKVGLHQAVDQIGNLSQLDDLGPVKGLLKNVKTYVPDIGVSGEVKLTGGTSGAGIQYGRISVAGSVKAKVNIFGGVGGDLKFERSWQFTQQHADLLGFGWIPISKNNQLDTFNKTKKAVGDLFSLEEGQHNTYASTNYSIATDVSLTGYTDNAITAEYDNGSSETVFTSSPYVPFVFNGNVEKIEIENYNSGHHIKTIDFLNSPSYKIYDGAVDFRDLEISAIDVNDAEKTISFIMKGNKTVVGNGVNAKTEGDLMKKVFLQALTIPNAAHFVSLDKPTGSGTTGSARGDADFKTTDLGQFFFAADAYLKQDVYEHIIQDEDVTAAFIRIFTSDMNKYIQLNDKGLTGYATGFRAIIKPHIPVGHKEHKKIFINDARYVVEDHFDNLSYPGFDPNSVSGSLREYYNQKHSAFRQWLVKRLDYAVGKVAYRINAGVNADYAKLKQILPAIVAAHWYKVNYRNDREAQFRDLIDSRDLSNKWTGFSLYKSFDQAYWDQQAFRAIAAEKGEVNGISYDVVIRGGVESEDAKVSSIPDNLQSGQEEVINKVLNSPGHRFTKSNVEYFNTWTPKTNLPELFIDKISLGMATRNADNGIFEAGKTGKVTAKILNLGTKRASNFSARAYLRKVGTNNYIGDRWQVAQVITSLDRKREFNWDFNVKYPEAGVYELFVEVNMVSPRLPEVSYRNNIGIFRFQSVNVSQADHCYRDARYSNDLTRGQMAYLGRQVATSSNIKNNHIRFKATQRIELKPGFRTNGNIFRAHISNEGCGSSARKYTEEEVRNYVSEEDLNYVERKGELSEELKAFKELIFKEGPISAEDEKRTTPEGIAPEYVIFPVPFLEQLQVSNLETHQERKIVVSDLSGRIIVEKEVEDHRSNYLLDMPLVRDGHYILRVFTDKGTFSYQISK